MRNAKADAKAKKGKMVKAIKSPVHQVRMCSPLRPSLRFCQQFKYDRLLRLGQPLCGSGIAVTPMKGVLRLTSKLVICFWAKPAHLAKLQTNGQREKAPKHLKVAQYACLPPSPSIASTTTYQTLLKLSVFLALIHPSASDICQALHLCLGNTRHGKWCSF